MTRKWMLLCLWSISVQSLLAESTRLVIQQKNGQTTEVLFSDTPVATYEEEEMVVTTAKATLRFPLARLDHASFAEGTTGLKSPISVLSGKAGPSYVYTVMGVLVREVPEGQPVQLEGLPAGMYIIRNSQLAYKIKYKP